MKIEAGKYYKTRDGRKVLVINELKNPFLQRSLLFPFIAFISDRSDIIYYKEDGSSECLNADIVYEWKEPKVVKGWVNVFEDGDIGFLRDSKEACESQIHEYLSKKQVYIEVKFED